MRTANLIICVLAVGLASCVSGPKPIGFGKEECVFCKMTIMDKQFGCQVVNTKGKHFNFDDLSCLIGYLDTDIIPAGEIGAIYVPDYTGNHPLLPAEGLFYVESEALHSPMAGNMAAFSGKDSAQRYAASLQGKMVTWQSIIKQK